MAGDSQMRLRVSRLENDSNSIYELITEFRSTQLEHSQRLDRVELRLDKVELRLDKIEQRLDKIEQRLDMIELRFDRVEQGLDKIGTTLTEVLRRLPAAS